MIHNYAWAAGVFEGEGCISVQRNTVGHLTPVMVVKMTDKDVVERLFEVMGRGSVYTYKKTYGEGARRIPYQWRITGWDNLHWFAETIGPFLGERRTERLNEVLAMEPTEHVRGYIKAGQPSSKFGWVAP